MAERVGFEPTVSFPTPVFKTGAINRSTISPWLVPMARPLAPRNCLEAPMIGHFGRGENFAGLGQHFPPLVSLVAAGEMKQDEALDSGIGGELGGLGFGHVVMTPGQFFVPAAVLGLADERLAAVEPWEQFRPRRVAQEEICQVGHGVSWRLAEEFLAEFGVFRGLRVFEQKQKSVATR
jgi:hypothetical protein